MTRQPSRTRAPIAIAVIDDHDVVHAGVAMWCALTRPAIRVVGSYTTAAAFLRHHPAANRGIDAIAFDLELTSRTPDFNALQAVIDAGHRAVVYSHLHDVEIVLRCVDIGAASYVTKDEGKTHLIAALRAAANDASYVPPHMAGALNVDQKTGRPNLAPREKDALLAWFQTKSLDFAAARLAVTPATVRTLLERSRAKYAAVGRPAATKAALLARAIQDGLISVNDL